MTRLYPSAVGVAVTPATVRGAWDKTAGHIVCGMGSAKDLSGLGGPLSIASAETVSTTDYDVLLLRCVSAPLAADHNFSGTMNVMIAVQESNTDADMAYYVHAFVTQGDTDNLRGTLAMARTMDPNSATAQFFINVVDNGFLNKAQSRDGNGYAVFGKVVSGMEVVDKIRAVPTGNKGMHQNVPLEPVVINKATLEK